MDGRALFPHGWHPQHWNFYPDGKLIGPERFNSSRTSVGGVRYYYIDFGISTLNQDRVLGLDGQERAPELSDTQPYDPYKLDVYILGMAYANFILAVSLLPVTLSWEDNLLFFDIRNTLMSTSSDRWLPT